MVAGVLMKHTKEALENLADQIRSSMKKKIKDMPCVKMTKVVIKPKPRGKSNEIFSRI